MKKLLVIALSVVMVLAFAAVSMAEVTFSGEIDAGYKSLSTDAVDDDGNPYNDQSMPYIFGKITATAKLGDSVTGVLTIKNADADIARSGNVDTSFDVTDADDATKTHTITVPGSTTKNVSSFAFDEASITFAEPFGSIKAGYYCWNPNLKDVIDTYRGDLKNDVNVGGTIKFTENFSLDFAYGIPTTDNNGDTDGVNDGKYGVMLAFATDSFGADVNYSSNTSGATKNNDDPCTVTGVDVWYLINGFKPYIQYEVVNDVADSYGLEDDPTNEIIGFIYDSADVPVYGRVEYDLSDANGKEHETGIRVGYKLASGAKLEAQYYDNVGGTTDSKDYVKVICPF